MPPAWLPTHSDLHGLLSTRAVGDDSAGLDAFGGTLPAFTTATAIKIADAELAISLTSRRVVPIVGATTVEHITDLAALLNLYLAAADLEAKFFPRQTSRDQTANTYWTEQAALVRAELVEAVNDAGVGDDPGPEDNVGAGTISSWFPASRMRHADGTERVL